VSGKPYQSKVSVFGGTGYLGRCVVRQLVQNGYRVRVAVRHPQPALFQDLDDTIEQIQADVTDVNSVTCAIQGVDSVVNTVGLYVETSTASFSAVHVAGASYRLPGAGQSTGSIRCENPLKMPVGHRLGRFRCALVGDVAWNGRGGR
jgi:NAD(P)-dependent dehydrogenase (short-subunit alcohol dehydrogenase family)